MKYISVIINRIICEKYLTERYVLLRNINSLI